MSNQISAGDGDGLSLIRTAPYTPESSAHTINHGFVQIRHPGYDDFNNTLLFFRPLDNHGVHCATVQAACAVLVDNQSVCFLSTDKEGHDSVDTEPEAILTLQSYYLQVRNESGMLSDYPITPTFEHWRFPHESLPSNWKDIPSFQQPLPDSSSTFCQLTERAYAVHDAHIVPSSQKEWFNNNGMRWYTASDAFDRMKTPNNLLRLQSHIHTMFDAKRFAIVPMKGHLVAYCINGTPQRHFERDFHRVRLFRYITEDLNKFLFARFAYTVFENLSNFLTMGVPRRLRVFEENKFVVKEFHHLDCRDFARDTALQGKSKSGSPTKRARTDGPNDALDRGWWTDESGSTDEEEESRGRKRRRSKSSSWVSSHTSTLATSQELPKRQSDKLGILLMEKGKESIIPKSA